MAAPIAPLRTTTVFSGPKFDVLEERVRLASGNVSRHITLRHPGAAVILPRHADGSLIVLQQYRHSIRKTLLEFPAGTLEPGEEPLVGAKRELAEETGQLAQQWESLGELVPAPGFCDEIQHCFFATELTSCDTNLDDDEFIEIITMTSEQIAHAIQSGMMVDGKSIAIYARAKFRGFV